MIGPPELEVVLALTRSAGSGSQLAGLAPVPGLGIRSKVSDPQGLQCMAQYQHGNLDAGIFIS